MWKFYFSIKLNDNNFHIQIFHIKRNPLPKNRKKHSREVENEKCWNFSSTDCYYPYEYPLSINHASLSYNIAQHIHRRSSFHLPFTEINTLPIYIYRCMVTDTHITRVRLILAHACQSNPLPLHPIFGSAHIDGARTMGWQ